MSITVIGAGIIGLSTAVYIQEREPRAKVSILADKFSGQTTSDIAAGHWRTAFLGDPRTDVIKRWAGETYDELARLFSRDPDTFGAGRVSGYELYKCNGQEIPFWADVVPDFRRVGKTELERLGWAAQFKDGFFFTSYYLECKRYLPVLMEKFLSNGGEVRRLKLNNLDELAETDVDVIVNCTGLGSRDLIHDHECYPIRGQVIKIRAPFVKYFLMTDNHYILPNHEIVTLGGTHQENDWRLQTDEEDSKRIWDGTTALCPAIKKAQILGHFAGLRPGRREIRLEIEHTPIGRKIIPVVHNYGHGGSGITLYHGCANEAADLAKCALHKKSSTTSKAKL